MSSMHIPARLLNGDQRGVTALEYGLIAGVIVATIAVGLSVLQRDGNQPPAPVPAQTTK